MITDERNMTGWRFQEFQFDSDLDPWWLRSLKKQQRIGGRVAHDLRDLWEDEILARVQLIRSPEPIEPPTLVHRGRACPIRKPIRRLTVVAAQGCYAVEIHVKIWARKWVTVLIGSLSREQAAPFFLRGKLRPANYGPILPLVIRHQVYADASLLRGRPELRCLLSGKLPEMKLV